MCLNSKGERPQPSFSPGGATMSPVITGTSRLNPRSHLFHQTKQGGQEGANFVLVIRELRSVDEKWQQVAP